MSGYAAERAGNAIDATNFQINSTLEETIARLIDAAARLRVLTQRTIGALPPSKTADVTGSAVPSATPADLVNRFRSQNRRINEEINDINNYISALQETL